MKDQTIMKSKSHKTRVKRAAPNAFCVKLNDGSGYIVWPGRVQPRGFEQGAIGLAATARAAWASVKFETPKPL